MKRRLLRSVVSEMCHCFLPQRESRPSLAQHHTQLPVPATLSAIQHKHRFSGFDKVPDFNGVSRSLLAALLGWMPVFESSLIQVGHTLTDKHLSLVAAVKHLHLYDVSLRQHVLAGL